MNFYDLFNNYRYISASLHETLMSYTFKPPKWINLSIVENRSLVFEFIVFRQKINSGGIL